MTTNELANRLTSELKAYLKQRGYIDSGKLFNSIKFTVTDNPFDIKLDAEPYIVYLDNGKLLDNFFNQAKISELFAQYLVEKIDELIGASL